MIEIYGDHVAGNLDDCRRHLMVRAIFFHGHRHDYARPDVRPGMPGGTADRVQEIFIVVAVGLFGRQDDLFAFVDCHADDPLFKTEQHAARAYAEGERPGIRG